MSRLAALLFVLFAAPSFGQTLSGSLVGADGAPLPAAHAFLIPAGDYDPAAQAAVGKDGRFALAAAPGLYTLRLTGVHHRALDVPLWLDEDVDLDARLAAVPVFGSPEDVRAQVHGHLVYRLERQPDATFAATVLSEADTLAYRIAGAFAHGRPAAGTMADRFAYDGDGGYYAVLDTPADSVALTFDPRRIPRSDALPEVNFADPDGRASRVTAILTGLDNRSDRVYAARRRALAETQGQPPDERADALDAAMARFDLAAEDARLAAAIEAEADDIVRQALLLNYVSVETAPEEKDAALALRALREIAPDAPLWALHPALVQRTLDLAAPSDSAAAAESAAAILREHPTPAVRGFVLLHQLIAADLREDVPEAQRLFSELQSDDYAETDPGLIAAALLEHYDTRPGLRVGAEIPDFTLTTLDGRTLTRASLLGTVYLLEFWAIWCSPCIREMPTLHAAYERFADAGFEIVSVSFDETAEEVEAFRAERFPMPWANVHVGADFGGEVARTFEVASLPKPLLVGADGRLVARDAAVRGANLERVLEQLLGDE